MATASRQQQLLQLLPQPLLLSVTNHWRRRCKLWRMARRWQAMQGQQGQRQQEVVVVVVVVRNRAERRAG